MTMVQRLIGLGVDLSTKKALKRAIKMLGLKPENIDRLYIELKNEMHKSCFSRIKPKDRAVFLPHCLRKTNACKAKLGEDGYACVGCSKDCKVNQIKQVAEGIGYSTFIVPGGSMVAKIIGKYRPKAVFGVACLKELNISAEEIPIPTQSVELSKDGCVNTDVDLEKVKAALNL